LTDSGQDLVNDLQSLMLKMNRAVDVLAANGRKLADAERIYRVALAKEILKEREAGIPVTIIGDLARGDSTIADLKFARDAAQAVYDANNEALQAWKLQARLMEAQISREWGRREI
jgi:hypothetical protein